MKRHFGLLAMSSALALCVSVPALAQDEQVAVIDIDYGVDRAATIQNFSAPVERLSLRAREGEVYCETVSVKLTDGRIREIYSGQLASDLAITVDLPLDQQNVSSVDFLCTSEYGPSAVEVAADVASPPQSWSVDPTPQLDRTAATWQRASHMVPLGHERFSGSFDRETEEVNVATQEVSSIALKPIDNDAQCTRVNAHFANGTTQTLAVNSEDRLNKDMIYRLDLPIPERDLTQVEMECTALGDDDVTIEVYAAG
jgi:hypothetical protein